MIDQEKGIAIVKETILETIVVDKNLVKKLKEVTTLTRTTNKSV